MITMQELADIRVTVRTQQERMAQVEQRIGLALAHADEHGGLRIRCPRPHRGGKGPRLAELHATAYGTIFISTIPWAPSDATALRPWIEETHLSQLFRGRGPDLDDDDLLRAAVENLRWWQSRGPGDHSGLAERKQRAHVVREVLDLPSTDGRLSLWVRCPVHLDDFEELDPSNLMNTLR